MKEQGFLPVTQHNNSKDLVLKDMNETNVKNLFQESLEKSKYYDVYVRLSPKKDSVRTLQNSQGSLHQQSKGKTNESKVKDQATKSEILELISQINENIRRIELKVKIAKNKEQDKNQAKLNKSSPEFKALRKKTMDLINEGDEL